MSGRYSPTQLRAMAREALDAQSRGDARFELLIIQLSLKTGLEFAECVARITRLARWHEA